MRKKQNCYSKGKTIASLKNSLLKLEKLVKAELSALPNRIAMQVSSEIVGESYYKWDSVSQYFPTLIFCFRESKASNYPRRSQIKIRLKETNKDLVEEDITRLQVRAAQLGPISYKYGTVRCNYVSRDKRFKTTVFTKTKGGALKLLEPLLDLIDDPFEKQNLSYTLNRTKINPFKRLTPLANIRRNRVNYLATFELELIKIVLLVNGLDAPIVILKN